ncbi:hypothetical protein DSUL_80078 [Desulfovibrionales bacterium]
MYICRLIFSFLKDIVVNYFIEHIIDNHLAQKKLLLCRIN